MAVSPTNSTAQLMQQAIAHHTAGRSTEAEAIYRQILSLEPNQPDALHLLGVLAGQNGRPSEAIEWIERAITASPRTPLYYDSLAESYRRMGKLDEAAKFFGKEIELAPNSADAVNKLGCVQKEMGKPDEAIAAFRRAVRINPNFAESHMYLGEALRMRGELNEAIEAFSRVVNLQPQSAEARNNLGVSLMDIGKVDEAIAEYQRAVRLKPDYADAYENLGRALGQTRRFDEAITAFKQAADLNPNDTEVLLALGSAYFEKKRFEESLDAWRKVARLKPDYAPIYNEVGSVLSELGRLDEAAENFHKALSLDPNLPQALCNLSLVHVRRGELDQAEALCRQVIALRPDDEDAHYNLAMSLLVKGDLSEGWREYEWRWRYRGHGSGHHKYSFAQWNGEDLRGRKILLHCEQGFGDIIQFIRYVPLVAERGGRVILAVPSDLFSLVKDIPGAEKVIADEQTLSLDVQCPLLSLPLAFNTRLETIPAKVPYLWPDANRVEQWKQKVRPSEGLKIGLVWAGRPAHVNDRNRSMRLSDLAPLGAIPKTVFYSLQKGEPSAQATNPPAGIQLIDLTDSLRDFADTAALIAQLDLVIAVDTAVAHLAGAMGKPIWVLLPFTPDWRWMMNREDSPWYPTMRLFRQPRSGDWQTPVARLADALRSFESKK